MFDGSCNKQFYIEEMQNRIKMLNYYRSLENGSDIKLGRKIKQNSFVELFLKHGLIKRIIKKINYLKLKRIVGDFEAQRVKSTKQFDLTPNYFSSERIAVYTCIFGKYDEIIEPLCNPDNIDYYIITDQKISGVGCWKVIDINQYSKELTGLSNVEKNRWFKMHPHIVFQEYKYSIYMDGNIVPITDFTEFVNKIGNYGIAMNKHTYNSCVYKEALFNKYTIKKISSDEIDAQIKYLKSEGMPEEYGMTTCNVIARDHTNDVCKNLMDEWWKEFVRGCKRDQLTFPFVAWKKGIPIAEISTLGNDSWNHHAYYVNKHTH